MGRPSIYTEKLAKDICDRLAKGESLRAICRDDEMPDVSTVRAWTDERPDFSSQYGKARSSQAQHLFDELLEIADDGTNDFVEKELERGKVVINPNTEHIARSRLRVDTRKWYLSKVLPKLYGEKVDLTTNGKDLPTPIISLTNAVPRDNGDKED